MPEDPAKLSIQANKLMAQKTLFGKANPDREAAVELYSQAANAYKAVKAFRESADHFMLAGECYGALDAIFLAAKVRETGLGA